MASKKIIADWIQYLKNNQIVSMQSDPATGRLNYKRKVYSSDLVNFLQVKTDFDDKTINDAIDTVLGNRSKQPPADSNISVNKSSGQQNIQTARPGLRPGDPGIKHMGDVEYANDEQTQTARLPAPTRRLPPPAQGNDQPTKPGNPPGRPQGGGRQKGVLSQTPGAIRKRSARSRRGINEDFKDDPGEELHEKDVEAVFKILSAHSEKSAKSAKSAKSDPAQVKADNIKKIKDYISNSMTPETRKQLWDALHEIQASNPKDDISLSENISTISNISFYDLQKKWAYAGYPTNTTKIAPLLRECGFSDNKISKVFSTILKEAGNTQYSKVVMKIVNYIEKSGTKDDIIAFMQQNFADELNPAPATKKPGIFQQVKDFGKKIFSRNTTNEEVKQIFELILKEDKIELAKRIEYNRLGRNRKK